MTVFEYRSPLFERWVEAVCPSVDCGKPIVIDKDLKEEHMQTYVSLGSMVIGLYPQRRPEFDGQSRHLGSLLEQMMTASSEVFDRYVQAELPPEVD